jgi:NACalpha-BTF3-like transcription factor
MSPQLVEAYGPFAEFYADMNHMYIKAKKDPREEWVQTKYKIMEEDIQLVMQDWEPDWKVPTQGDEQHNRGTPR